MASIKVKFRPSTLSNKEGTVYYQIIHRRTIRQLKTPYQLFAQEWDPKAGKAIITANIRHNLLLSINNRIQWDVKLLQSITHQWDYYWDNAITLGGGYTYLPMNHEYSSWDVTAGFCWYF